MNNLIEKRVAAARRGENPFVITRMPSGWLVIGDVQPLPGYCLLLADPVAESPNTLTDFLRARYALDMYRAGDALLAVTGAHRINYMTLCNAEPSLHTHIIPRFRDEPEDKRLSPPFQAYDWATSRPYDPVWDGPLVEQIKAWLKAPDLVA